MDVKSQKSIIVVVLVVLVLGAAGGWYWYANMREFITTDDALVDSFQSTISPKALGKITALTVKEGDQVAAGQVLVRMDDSNLRAQEDQDRAALVNAQQKITLDQVSLNKAQADFQRASSQFKEGFISNQDYDHLKNTVDAARAQLAVETTAVKTAQAKLEIDGTQLQDSVLAAPMNGVISKRWVTPGDVVQPGQPIFSLFDDKHVWITANFEETKMASLRLNQPVDIEVDAYPGTHFNGHIINLGSSTAAQFSLIPPNNASGNFTKVTQRVPIKIAIDTHLQAKPLLPGMSVEVKVKVR